MPSSQASSSRSAAFRSTMPPSPQNPPTSKNGKWAPTCAEKESLPRRRGLQEFDVRTSRKGSLPPHPPGLATMRMAARPSSVLQRNARRTRPYCSARPAGAVQVGNITARARSCSSSPGARPSSEQALSLHLFLLIALGDVRQDLPGIASLLHQVRDLELNDAVPIDSAA